MATVPGTTPKIDDAAVGEMISRGAAERGMTEEDYVVRARKAYQHRRTDEIRAAMRRLDGTRRSRVASLAGITPEQLDNVGGVRE